MKIFVLSLSRNLQKSHGNKENFFMQKCVQSIIRKQKESLIDFYKEEKKIARFMQCCNRNSKKNLKYHSRLIYEMDHLETNDV